MDANFRDGWLVFERDDGSERRRLAQVPEDWESLSNRHLSRRLVWSPSSPPPASDPPTRPRPTSAARERGSATRRPLTRRRR
jgi:hypothetical protein